MQCQLGSVDGRGVALGHEHLMRLQGSHLFPVFGAILPLGHIEDHGMGMKLRRRVAIDGPRGIVLESGGDEFPRRLRGMHIADPRLRVALQFLKRYADTLAMGFPHPVIAANERSQRYRLRRGKRGVPPGAVLGAGHFLAEFPVVGSRNLMTDKLLFGVRMLALAQPPEVLSLNSAGELPLLGEPALPLTMALLIAAPVVLFLRGKLTRMVSTCLAS